MKPSKYIETYGIYKDIHALEQELDVYKWENFALAQEIAYYNLEPSYTRDSEWMARKQEFLNEIVFAEQTIKEWREASNVAV